MCVHTLSPAGHGATLVWFPGGAAGKIEYLDLSVAITPPALSVVEASHASAIAHSLSQLDRAAIVDADGGFIQLNVSLSHSPHADEDSFEGGTRHNSAGRYSASQPNAIVFVVSADGPVTVFQNGDVVASIVTQARQV
jgi:DNA integrity scanning protein DisA with diadenylate cyclase activity